MNHRESPPLSAGARRALRSLSLLLVPALALETAPAMPRPRHAFGQGAGEHGGDYLPYLVMVGAPALRFERSVPPPDLVAGPAAAAPPVASRTLTETSVALENAAAARSTAATPRGAGPGPGPGPGPGAGPGPETELPAGSSPPLPKPTPRAILPDDTRPKVRPEDFLPYFQIPGSARSANEVNVIMPANSVTSPAPATLPPSTATFTQPK